MLLLSKQEFIGDMPEQYRETIRGIRKALFREKALLNQKQRQRKAGFDLEIEEIRQRIYVLLEMEQDMCRAKRTVENYYKPGGRYDDEYCLLGHITGGSYHRLGSPVERLVARSVRFAGWHQ